MPTYEVTCRFDGHYWGEPAAAVERSVETVADLRDRDVEIDHRGGELTLDADGTVASAVLRYTAPTEGHVGWLTVDARLPVSGIRRVEGGRSGSPGEPTESDDGADSASESKSESEVALDSEPLGRVA
jgi:hypothetical protein